MGTLLSAVAGVANYNRRGFSVSMGMEPHGLLNGEEVWRSYNSVIDSSGGFAPKHIRDAVRAKNSVLPMAKMGKDVATGMFALNVGGTAFMIASGFAEGGMSGAFQAGAMDVAASAAVARKLYTQPMDALKAANPNATVAFKQPGFMKYGFNYLTANIGAAIGYELGSYPGMYLGAMAGVSGRARLLGVGVAAASAGAYGAYSVLSAGNQHRQAQKMVHTAGDMSSFMTSGAMTMRARAVEAIHKSHINARSALGNEASFMHMPGRNYHSKYRAGY